MVGCGPGAEQHVETIIAAYQEVGIRCVLSLQVGNRSAVDCLPGARKSLPAHLLPLLANAASDVPRIIDFVAAPLASPPARGCTGRSRPDRRSGAPSSFWPAWPSLPIASICRW
jgi:hypothetical protein